MAYNKFIKKDGTVMLDLTDMTVSAETLGKDITAVDKYGNKITGIGTLADSPLPIEVSTEEEMNELLVNGELNGVYKYVGTTGTYESNALYVRVEPTLETSDGYCVVDSEGSIISLKVAEFIKLILRTDLEDITITENGEYSPSEDGYSKVTVEVPQPQLYAPTISLDGDFLRITPNADNGAFVYRYYFYVDGLGLYEYFSSTTTVINLPNEIATLGEGTYSITVTAIGEGFKESEPSNEVSYVQRDVDYVAELLGTWTLNASAFDFSMISDQVLLHNNISITAATEDGTSNTEYGLLAVNKTVIGIGKTDESAGLAFTGYPEVIDGKSNQLSSETNNKWTTYSTFTINELPALSLSNIVQYSTLLAFLQANATKQ